MKTHIARSVFEILASLEQALLCDRHSRAERGALITKNYHSKMVMTLKQLRARLADVQRIQTQFAKTLRERREHVDELSLLVRDFYHVLRRRERRSRNGRELEILYQRPPRIPHYAPVIQWLEWAKNILAGEKEALALGHAPMTNPTAAELEQVLERATAAETLWSEQILELKACETQLRLARNQGTRCLRGLATRLRESQALEAPATCRELMRRYGFTFVSTGAKDRRKAQLRPANTPAASAAKTPQLGLVTDASAPLVFDLCDQPKNQQHEPDAQPSTAPHIADVAANPALTAPEPETRQRPSRAARSLANIAHWLARPKQLPKWPLSLQRIALFSTLSGDSAHRGGDQAS